MCALCPAQNPLRVFSQAFKTVCLLTTAAAFAVAASDSERDSDSTVSTSQQSPRQKRATLERSFWDATPDTGKQQGPRLGNNVPPDSPHGTGPAPTSVWPNGLSASYTDDYAPARDPTEVHGVNLPLNYLDPVPHQHQQTFSGAMPTDSRQNDAWPQTQIFAGGASNNLSALSDPRSAESLMSGSPLAGTAVSQRHGPRASTNVVDRLEPRLVLDDSRPPSRDRPPHPFGGGSRSVPTEKMTLASISSRRPSAAISTSGPLASGMLSPVDLGYLSPLEATWLFDQFLAKVCPLSALFDPAYTTYERSRNRPALQTAILWAASRFFRPDLESALHRHAEFLINRATNSGLVDLQTLQAIHVLVIWKEPNDRSAYMKIGIAVRMAYQLGLDTARTTALPQDEEEARSIVDAERTWIILLFSDLAYSNIFSLPSSVRNHRDYVSPERLTAWAEEHAHLDIPGDFHLAFSAGLDPNSDVEACPAAQPGADSRAWTLATRERQLQQHLSAWVSRPYLSGLYRHMARFHTTSLVISCKIAQLKLSPSDLTKTGVIMCLQDLIEHLEPLASTAVMPYWSDLVTTSLSTPGLLIYKARQSFDPHQLAVILDLLSRIAQMCDAARGDRVNHALSHVSRFYKRLVAVLNRVKERSANAIQQQVPAINEPQDIAWAELDALFGTTMEGNPDLSSIWDCLVDNSGEFPWALAP